MTLTEEIERVLALSELATPGEWANTDSTSADIFAPTGDVAVTICQQTETLRFDDRSTIAESSREVSHYNAAFIAAAVNAWREHGPTILALAERLETAEERVRVLENALIGIHIYGSDTLSGPESGSDDRKWQRDGVLEMTKRARAAIDTARAGEK